MNPSIDIVLPCFNPGNKWQEALITFHDAAKDKYRLHFILVNDGSHNAVSILQQVDFIKENGVLIDYMGIGLLFDSGSACREPGWFATPDDQCTQESYEGERFDPAFMVDESAGTRGPTPLIAAMRCYVASKLGDEVDVPEEFLNG